MADNDLIIRLNSNGEREPMIEIARSFTMKVNCGNYESADFFMSAKQQVPESEADDLSERLYIYCRREVLKNVAEFVRERPDLAVRNQQRRTA